VAETLVGEDDGGGREAVARQAAADHVDAVERGLGGDRLGLAREGEARIGDGELEVLGHMATVDDGAYLEADLVLGPRSGARLRSVAARTLALFRSRR
jgi:hypothetical protein